jgi:hypothetical protein
VGRLSRRITRTRTSRRRAARLTDLPAGVATADHSAMRLRFAEVRESHNAPGLRRGRELISKRHRATFSEIHCRSSRKV